MNALNKIFILFLLPLYFCSPKLFGQSCAEYTIGGYNNESAHYVDCGGDTLWIYTYGSGASGYDAETFCATEILWDDGAVQTGPGTAPGVLSGFDTVCAGSTTQFSSTIGGGNWSSDAPSIATVNSSGLVTGISTGTATITYTSPGFCSSSTTRDITVIEPPDAPINLTATPNTGCPPYNTILNGACASGVLRWYNSATATGLGISPNQIINSNTRYYARCYDVSYPSPCNYSKADSIDLTTINITYDTVYDTICNGETISFGGNNYTSSGLYNDTLLTGSGCDSIVTLDLMVAPIYQDTINQNICDGYSYSFNGQNITSSGIYNDTLNTIFNCDSIITLNLSVNPIYRDTLNQTICNGQSYTFGGNNYNTSGTYYDSLSSSFGCDSIKVLNLIITPVIRDTIFARICNNQSYSFGSNNYNITGNYSDSLITPSGCDSISTLALTVNNNSFDTTRTAICQGDSYNFRGSNYNTTGVYNDTINNTAGCDSVSTLILTVNPTYHDSIYDTICEGGNYNFYGKNISTSGIYLDTLNTLFGCDSIFTLFLHVIPTPRDSIFASICEGDSYLFAGIPRTLDGIYNETIILPNGCDSITTLILTVYSNPSISIMGNSIFCNNTLGTLSSDGSFPSYLWNTGETTSSISFYDGGLYRLVVTDQNNCEARDSILVTKTNCEDTCQIYVPNAFTPNRDGFNDLFYVKAPNTCLFLDYRFLIFNRWGELLFESQNIEDTWDGNHQGIKSQIDTYVWLLEYKKQDDIIVTKRIGHVNVIR